jgi:hypothetical protein
VKGRGNFGGLDAHGRIILKWILKHNRLSGWRLDSVDPLVEVYKKKEAENFLSS